MIRNETNIRQLDLVLNEARLAGIRIICAMCNNWEQFGYAGGHVVVFVDHCNQYANHPQWQALLHEEPIWRQHKHS